MSATSTLEREAREEFELLLDLPCDQRERRLAELAASRPELADRLAALLAHDAESGGFLEEPLLASSRTAALGLGPGDRVGPWRLLELIGEGGSSVVFRAERADGAFVRAVAVKLLRFGFHSPEGRRRLHRERRILAGLDHPGIARLLDGGATAEGLPWFALELVVGEPLLAAADRRQASVEQRLELWLEIAAAVAFAHRKLVVHRDLKPSNVLVDSSGRPRLLDFGIARLLHGEQSEETTSFAALTPRYASPEQRCGQPGDTASDVFALGQLLSELLVGEPLEAPAGAPGWRPPSALAERAAPAVAALRGLTPQRLARRLRGDLDAMAARALELDPAQRYPTVDAFAEDVQRHLQHRPVRAREVGVGTALLSWARRHQLAATGIALGLLAALVVPVVVTYHLRQVAEQRDVALYERQRTATVSAALVDMVARIDPLDSNPAAYSAEQLVAASEDPVLAARFAHSVGALEARLGHSAAARRLLTRALAARDPDRDPAAHADTLLELATLDRDEGHLDEADRKVQRVLRLRAAIGDPLPLARAHLAAGWIAVRRDQFARAQRAILEALRLQTAQLPPRSLELAESHLALAVVYGHRDNHRGARDEIARTLTVLRHHLGDDHLRIAEAQTVAGLAHWVLGNPAAATAAFEDALRIRRLHLPETHLLRAAAEHNVATLALSRGELVEAQARLQAALDALQSTLAADHPLLTTSWNNLGVLAELRGDPAGAIALHRRALALRRRVYGASRETAQSVLNLGCALHAAGEPAAARRVWSEVPAVLGNGPDTWQLAALPALPASCLHPREAARPAAWRYYFDVCLVPPAIERGAGQRSAP